ncbi:MAG: SPOR domain-containing protein, partial [Spirochaetia bacterium]|nr:SPOR domain-containing protein [Spirochaetia bacterium]
TAAYYGKNKLKGSGIKNTASDDYYLSPSRNVTESSANVIQDGTLSGYSVQVGVFGELRNAVGMQKMLSSYGDPVHILKGNGVYIVRVGDYPTRYQAEKMKYSLVSDGYKGFIYEPAQYNDSLYQ